MASEENTMQLNQHLCNLAYATREKHSVGIEMNDAICKSCKYRWCRDGIQCNSTRRSDGSGEPGQGQGLARQEAMDSVIVVESSEV